MCRLRFLGFRHFVVSTSIEVAPSMVNISPRVNKLNQKDDFGED